MMIRLFTRTVVVAVVVGALAGVSATTANASARASRNVAARSSGPKPVTCHSGDIITGIHGTVTIPSGNFCELLQATVDGNVIAQRGAIQLGIDNSQITGRVTAVGVTDNGWICGSRTGGNVAIANSASNPEMANSPGMWDVGFPDPQYCGNASFDPVPGNAIGGNLTFVNNRSGGALADNDIEQNLVCTGNAPAPAGANNQVDKSAKGQCSSMNGGVDNDTTSPGDND